MNRYTSGQITEDQTMDLLLEYIREIRNGDITRDEGIALVKRFDGEFPHQYIEDCTNYMDISLQDYHDAIEKFRSPHLWKRKSGKWQLKQPIWK